MTGSPARLSGVLLLLGLLLPSPAVAQSPSNPPVPVSITAPTLLFGPKQYLRTTGSPNQYPDNISVPAGIGAPFLLYIANGDGHGGHYISSASVSVNGVPVASPSDFGPYVAFVTKGITLNATNTLSVKLVSTPGAYLTISIYGTPLPQPVSLKPDPLVLTVGATGTLTATLSGPAGNAGTMIITSSPSGVLEPSLNLPVKVEQTAVDIRLKAYAVGTTTVTASLNGKSVSSTVQVVPTGPTVTMLLPATLSITQGGTGTLTVRLNAAQSSETAVAVSSDDSGMASVPAHVSVPAGQTNATIAVSANTRGTATITASLNGTQGHSLITVTPALPTVVSLLPPTNPVTLGAATTLTVTISGAQSAPTELALSATPGGIVSVPATVTVPAGQTTAPITVGTIALGGAMVSASLNGTSAASAVQVLPPPPAIVSLLPSPLTVTVGATVSLTVTLNAAQLSPATIEVAVDQAGALQIPLTVTVPVGAPHATFTVTGLAVGDAIVTATINQTSQRASVHVIPSPPTLVSLLPSPLAIQQGAAGTLTLTINAAQLSQMIIPLTNSASSVVQAPSSVTVPAGQLTGTAVLLGLLPGSATLSASLTTTSASAMVQITAPPTLIMDLTPATQRRPKGTPGVLHVSVSPTSTTPTIVMLSSNVATIASVPPTVTVPAGQTGADFPVMTKGEGTATITASLNTSSASAQVTVTPAELVSLMIAPLTPTIFVSDSQAFNATGTLTDGTTQDFTNTVTWSSSDTGMATITANGVAQGLKAGSQTITASSAGATLISASTLLTILTPASLSLTPITAAVSVGGSLTLTVTSAAPAGASGLLVAFATSGTGVVTGPSSVLIPSGASSIDINLTGTAAGSVILTASAPQRVPASSTLTISNLVPAITGITPTQVLAGSNLFTLIINGSQFVDTSVITVDGQVLPTTFVNTTRVTATVPAAAVALAHLASVKVNSPAPGGGASNIVILTVANPVPGVTALTPTEVVPGGPAFTLTVDGTNFVSSSLVVFDGNPLTPTSVGATQLTVTVPASAIATAHAAQVVVSNPAPGGGASPAVTMNVSPLNNSPVANAGRARSATVGKLVTLDGRQSGDAESDLITFLWSRVSAPAGSVANLNTPTSSVPTFTPDRPGPYQWQLIVNDGKSASAPVMVTVTAFAPNAPPNADAGADRTAVLGQLMSLDGRRSSDPDDDRLTYRWSLVSKPAGSVAVVKDNNSVLASLTPDQAGTYPIQLIVNDGTADSSPVQVNIIVTAANAAPMASAGVDRNALTGTVVSLNGGGSRDPNGSPLSYRWSFVATPTGTTPALVNANTATPSFTPAASGEYLVRLVVNDGVADSVPSMLLVRAASPNPAPNAVVGADQVVGPTDTLTLDGRASRDPNSDPLTYRWMFISVPTGSAAVLSDVAAAQPTFVADLSGAYVVRLIVNDGVSNSPADIVVVQAQNVTSVAVTPANPALRVGQTQAFLATATFADGTTKDVSSAATWASSNITVSTISLGGVATALKVGTTSITASLGAITSPAQILTVTMLPPMITGFTPTTGTVGTVVTITGTNFDAVTPGNNQVMFNGTGAIASAVTATNITTSVPLLSTTGLLTVTTPGGVATSAAAFTVTAKQDFTLAALPSLATVVQGKSTTYQLQVTNIGADPVTGFVQLAASGLRPGVTAVFSPAAIAGGQFSTLTLTTSGATPAGTSTITLSGTAMLEGRSVERQGTMQMTVVAAGTTTLAGRVLASKDDAPLVGAKLKLGGQLAVTDASGNFFFANPPIGALVVLLDGPTAIYPADLAIPVTVVSGVANALPYPIYLHENSQHFVPIPPGQETIVTSPDVPGLTVLIPAGTTIMGWDGQPNTKMSMTIVPMDRMPLPPIPAGVVTRTVYMFSFGKPGGGIPNRPIPIIYPNDLGALPGQRLNLWYYDEAPTPDPTSHQWKIYGQGTVSQDGLKIIPDPGVGQPKFCCGGGFPAFPSFFDLILRSLAALGDRLGIGEPVDPSSGVFLIEKTDMVLPGIIPIQIKRAYRTQATGIGSLGEGGSFNFDVRMQSLTTQALSYVMPDGNRFIMSQQPDGTYTNTAYPFLRGTVVTPFSDGHREMRTKDGTLSVFNNGGYLTEQRDRNDNRLRINRDASNLITQIQEPGGRALTLTYTAVVRERTPFSVIQTITDPLGRVVRYGYDEFARLSTVTDPAGGVTLYTYDVSDQLITITDPKGITFLTNEYDPDGRVVKQTQANGGIWIFRYTTAGATITQTDVTDPNGNVTTYRFNSRQYLARQIDAMGQMTRYERDFATNQLMKVIDPLNRETKYTYDANGNVTSIIDPAGNPTIIEYEPRFNQLTKVTDALNQVTQLAYDPNNGNLLTVTDPLNHITTITYNSAGQPTGVTDPLSNTIRFGYDEVGNLVQTFDPLGNTTTSNYDAASRLTGQTDPRGKTTQLLYDPLNQVTQITDPISGLTRFTYDPNGNLLTVKDAKSQTTTYTYDDMDQLRTRTDTLGRVERYDLYDRVGNLQRFIDRKGQLTTVTYDSLNRHKAVTFPDSATSFVYDTVGRLTTVNDAMGGTVAFAYDVLDRLAQETTSLGTIIYTYDALGRRSAMQVAGQSTVTYQYDTGSRLTQVAQGGLAVGLNYDAAGRRNSLKYPNGTSTSYGYDAASRLLNIGHSGPAGLIESLTYTYDTGGNRISQTRSGGAATLLPPAVTAAYDAANEQVQFNSVSPNLSYDADGNLTSQTDASGTTTYTWDGRNRLSGISGPGVSATFSYDVWGRRVSKTINGLTMSYLYDGDDVVAEIGTSNAFYLSGLDIDEPFIRKGATNEYYLADGLGSALALTDDSGGVSTTYGYEPFGKTSVTGSSTNSFQFTSRENDGTGLYYYRARYYYPTLGRFISEDPIGFEGGDANLYAYVFNSPTNYTDPSGEIIPLLIAFCLRGAGSSLLQDVGYSILSGRKLELNWGGALQGCLTGGLNKASNVFKAAKAAKEADKFSRAPKSLMDQMVLDAARQGKGVKLDTVLGDPKFKGMEKWSYTEKSAAGLRSEVHYVRDPVTKQLMDFKFKHHAETYR